MIRASYILFALMITGLAISLFLFRQSHTKSANFIDRSNTVKEVLFLLERTEKLKNLLRKTVYDEPHQTDSAATFVFSAKHKSEIDSVLDRLHTIVLYDDQRLRIDTIRQLIDFNYNTLQSGSFNISYYKGVSVIITRAQSYAQKRLKEYEQAFDQEQTKLDLWTVTSVAMTIVLLATGIWTGVYENSSRRKLKKLHDSVKESKERFKLLATSIPQIIWIADSKGKIEYLSDQWNKYTGQTIAEGMEHFSSFIHEEDVESVRQKWKTAMVEKKPWQAEYRLRDLRTDTYIWFAGYTLPLKDEHGEVIKWIGSSSDITSQKLLNENLTSLVTERTLELNALNEILQSKNLELSNAQYFLQTVLDSSVELITAFDKNLNYTFVNKRLEKITGQNPNLLIGKNIKEVSPGFEHTDGYQYLLKALQGETIHIDSRKPYTDDSLIFETFVIPLKVNNEIRGVVTMQRDITSIITLTESLRKSNMELKRSNDDLQQFAHVTSHDLKEPVRKIKIYADLLKTSIGDTLPEKSKSHLDKISRSTSRIGDMIDGILQYSTVDAFRQTSEKIDLNDLFIRILEDLEVVIDKSKAEVKISPLPTITGTPILIYQLFYNLLNNSFKFINKDIAPVIQIKSTEASANELKGIEGALGNATYYRIEIKDNGIGFDQESAEKIFDTFLRLNSKDAYEGTGLGLALCKKIAQRHNGAITASGRLNEGATFFIFLHS